MNGATGDRTDAVAGPARESVAVILTCFNEGVWIEAAVASVLAQTAVGAISDIVIADDGSDAPTLAVLDRLAGIDPRIRVLHHSRFGLSKNRNIAVRHTSAPLLAFLDADDSWTPTKLASQLEILDGNDRVGLVYTGFDQFSNHAPDDLTPVRVVDHSQARDLTLAYFLNDPPIIPSSILLRRSVYDLAGGFDEKLPVFEDTEFFVRLSRITRFGAIVEPCVRKRSHSSSMTHRRQDLMMHHAFVAFHVARTEPRLLAYVPRRLAERARKLGNLEARDGNTDSAARMYRLSLALRPLHALTWLSLMMAKLRVTHLLYRFRIPTSPTKA